MGRKESNQTKTNKSYHLSLRSLFCLFLSVQFDLLASPTEMLKNATFHKSTLLTILQMKSS